MLVLMLAFPCSSLVLMRLTGFHGLGCWVSWTSFDLTFGQGRILAKASIQVYGMAAEVAGRDSVSVGY